MERCLRKCAIISVGSTPRPTRPNAIRLQSEIDAAAFHAYGLENAETQFILDDFHRVQNPRPMTENYFDLVAEKYDALYGAATE